MTKRRTLANQARLERGPKPKSRSKYSLKGKAIDYSGLTAAARPTAFHTNKRGVVHAPVEAKPPAQPKVPIVRVTATISGIHLRRGFVMLQNNEHPKIYMSDGALTRYDGALIVAEGDTVDCDIALEEKGPRVKRIINIKQIA